MCGEDIGQESRAEGRCRVGREEAAGPARRSLKRIGEEELEEFSNISGPA